MPSLYRPSTDGIIQFRKVFRIITSCEVKVFVHSTGLYPLYRTFLLCGCIYVYSMHEVHGPMASVLLSPQTFCTITFFRRVFFIFQQGCKIVFLLTHNSASICSNTCTCTLITYLPHSNPLCKTLLTFGVHIASAKGSTLHCNSSSSDCNCNHSGYEL